MYALHCDREIGQLGLDEIGRIVLGTTMGLLWVTHSKDRITGSFIMLDEAPVLRSALDDQLGLAGP